MDFFSKKLKDIQETQVIAKGLLLDDILSDKVLKEIKSKFTDDDVEVIPASIKFQIVPKQKPFIDMPQGEEKEKLKKGIQITLKPVDFISLEHPSSEHYEKKVVVITSNKNTLLKKFLD